MRRFVIALGLFVLPDFAFAQQAPTPGDMFAASHQLQVCQQDDGAMSAKAYDIETQLQAAQRQVTTLQAQIAAMKKPK
jgi:hypothetical protein